LYIINASCLLFLVAYAYNCSNCSIVTNDEISLYICSIMLALDANLIYIHRSVLVKITGGIDLGY